MKGRTPILITLALLGCARIDAQMPPGMQHCRIPPLLLCPDPKGGLPGSGIPGICKRLVHDGVVSAAACWDFVSRRTCAELLDVQVRSDRHHAGNCYGRLASNCCPTAIHADVSWEPVPVRRGEPEPVGIIMFANGNKLVEGVTAQRREIVLEPGGELMVMWVDASQKYNIPGADLHWEVHGISAADESLTPAAENAAREAALAADDAAWTPDPEVAYDGGAARVFATERRSEVPDADRIRNEAGTVSFWIQPQWPRDDQSGADFVQLGGTGLEIVKDRHFIRFRYANGRDDAPGGAVDIADWRASEWHHVAGIWTWSSVELYVDGRQAFLDRRGRRPPLPGDRRLSVGSAPADDATVAPARLSDLTVLNRNLSFDEVLEMFQAGPPRY